jgi:hypothetical protein
MSFRQRFIKCYTNEVLHFETTITSRDESEHATLKRQLRSSNDDFKVVIDEIILLLTNELHNHLIIINSTKDRYLINLRKSVFQRLTSHVTSHALRKVLLQYNLLVEQSIAIRACINVFTITIDLSCSHKIQKRLYQEDEDEDVLLLKNIYSH